MDSRKSTAIILLHEIYGINEHISDMRRKFAGLGFDVYCMDFFDGRVYDYEESEAAYLYFIEKVGFKKASYKVLDMLEIIRCKYQNVFVVGYSIGATIAWLCSEEYELIDGIVCYYGSRIRDYLDIVPKVETQLFFPEKEASFDIDDLIEKLSSKAKVNTMKFEGLHGFSDKYSLNYNKESKEMSEKLLIEFISR